MIDDARTIIIECDHGCGNFWTASAAHADQISMTWTCPRCADQDLADYFHPELQPQPTTEPDKDF